MSSSPGLSAPNYVYASLYALAAFILVDQVSDLATGLHPFQLSSSGWRFGAFGLAVGRLTTLVFVDAMLLIAALGRNDRGFLRFWSFLHLPLALFFVAGVLLFCLDAVEMRRSVPPAGARGLLLASARTAFVGIIAAVLFFWVGIAGTRATRRRRFGRGSPMISRVGP